MNHKLEGGPRRPERPRVTLADDVEMVYQPKANDLGLVKPERVRDPKEYTDPNRKKWTPDGVRTDKAEETFDPAPSRVERPPIKRDAHSTVATELPAELIEASAKNQESEPSRTEKMVEGLPLLYVGDSVTVIRSSGERDPDWKVAEVNLEDGTYVLRNEKIGASWVDDFDVIEEVQEDVENKIMSDFRFKEGETVSVPRGNGEVDAHGWRVDSRYKDQDGLWYVVSNEDIPATKELRKDVLERAQYLV